MSGDGVYEMLNLKRRERTSYPSRDAQPSLYLSFGFLFPILSSFFPSSRFLFIPFHFSSPSCPLLVQFDMMVEHHKLSSFERARP